MFLATTSIISLLVVLSYDAKGLTFEQMSSALGLTGNKDFNAEYLRLELEALKASAGVCTLKMEAELITRKTIGESFLKRVENIFTKEMATISVNLLGKRELKGLPLLQRKVMLQFTAGFDGKWKIPFEKRHDGSFQTITGHKEQLKFLHAKGEFQYADIKAVDAKAVRFDFENSAFYCLILLPNKKGKLAELRSNLLNIDIVNLKMKQEEMEIWIPSVELNYDTNLGEPLENVCIFC